MKKRKIIKFLLFLLLCYSLTQIAIWFFNTEKSKKEFATLEKEVLIDIKNNSSNYDENNNANNINNELKEERTIINFDKLLTINSDTKGWLIIKKLNISYPIMQSVDNEYYLNKNIYRENSISGSIFLDYRNNGFQDNNTILYGHNMKNGTMFGKLDNIANGKLGTDIDILIYTKEKNYKYKVFSAYEIEPKEFEMHETVENLIAKSKIDFQKSIDKNSKYLTLYTCTKSSIKRVIVHAVLDLQNPYKNLTK